MNVTFNTNPINRYNQKFNQCNPKPQSFTGNPVSTVLDTEDALIKLAAEESKRSSFFKPFSDFYDNVTDKIAKHFTSKVVDSKALGYVADKLKNSNNLFQQCLIIGSLITSGLYMEKTLTNDKLEKDRKNTLAVNQGLTFLVSTIGACTLDKYMENWWENVTAKFVGLQVEDGKFEKNFKDLKVAINKVNNELKKTPDLDVFKFAEDVKATMGLSEDTYTILTRNIKKAINNSDDKLKSIPKINLDKFIEKLVKDKKMNPLSSELAGKVKGMGLLRSMLVFGFVYRFFVPVVVTKPANMLCEKYLAHKQNKKEAKQVA